MFIASLLRDAAARLHIWFSRSSSVEKVDAVSYSPPDPIKLVDRMRAGREAVGHIHIASPPKRSRPIQPLPILCNVKSGDARTRLYCGPVAVAALIGADVEEVIRVIQRHRNNRRQVRGTRPSELQHVLQHFGYDMHLVADLNRNPPTLATWERERTGCGARSVVRRHIYCGQAGPDRRRASAADAGATLTAFTGAQHPNQFVSGGVYPMGIDLVCGGVSRV